MKQALSAELNPNPILQIGITGELEYINPAAKKLLQSLGLLIDQVSEILPPNFQEVAQNCILAQTTLPTTQMSLGNRYILWSSFFFNENAMIEFYGMDVTRIVRVEQSLRESKEKAEEGEKLKAAFLDNMSHEIRTPLNSLLGFLTLLNDELADTLSEDQKFYFDLINQNGNRLERTMREILDISHFSSGTYISKPSQIDINQVVKQISESLQETAAAKNLQYDLAFLEELTLVDVDEYCLTEAITHLIDNAIKYTDKGKVRVAVELSEKKVIIKIEDTGPGMSDEAQHRIFVAFNQGTMGHSKQFQGIGLGLALVRVYLDTIGATVDLDSEIGEGSRFQISIPLRV